jgi:hypothetical protein
MADIRPVLNLTKGVRLNTYGVEVNGVSKARMVALGITAIRIFFRIAPNRPQHYAIEEVT